MPAKTTTNATADTNTGTRLPSPRELMGSCALHPWPSWRDCEDGNLFGVLPNGSDRPATCPTHRDMERGFPPHAFVDLLARKAGIKIPGNRVKVTRKGIFIKGGDELGLLLEVIENHWPSQKYWLRPDCIWLLPNK